MNDTYAVVNKPKQRPPNSHRLSCSLSLAYPLYSTVKPKNRCSGVPGPSVTPTYDRFLDHRGAEASSAIGQGDYEPVPGVVNASSRNAKLAGTHAIRENSGAFTSTDDDYEYVSNPVRDTTGYCSPGAMGFNCRIKKPKGPRDPPAEWSRAER
ncbi:hypothetical protein SKAU_G00113290 [Synaphobranchus kaupii]|uniref:Uncharacterized protein n=1 Tax=Synaphobranchus kaupii TaxID=118154 RepID=A0A9Q1G209_SYNKA|nr:hypothetical protein SKAU_G00113290 [Synaphobranchus kaupii]